MNVLVTFIEFKFDKIFGILKSNLNWYQIVFCNNNVYYEKVFYSDTDLRAPMTTARQQGFHSKDVRFPRRCMRNYIDQKSNFGK